MSNQEDNQHSSHVESIDQKFSGSMEHLSSVGLEKCDIFREKVEVIANLGDASSTSSIEDNALDQEFESPKTVRSISLNDKFESRLQHDACSQKCADHEHQFELQLSAEKLLERNEFVLASQVEANLNSQIIDSSSRIIRKEEFEETRDISMQVRSSPSTSFRYCYTEQTDQHEQQKPHLHEAVNGRLDYNSMQGFSEAQPKLTFASRRMKEYFESFKSRHNASATNSSSLGKSHRLYQFFKSTRTEMVACLLFSVIVFQALISCRTDATGSAATTTTTTALFWPSDQTTPETIEPSKQLKANLISNEQSNKLTRFQVHLIGGLVASFSVATLTQVFGHISGCHLLPSVSLALYFKGHITRTRLASYLAAQAFGSLVGVGLLSLLTSSQFMTPLDRRFALNEALSSVQNETFRTYASNLEFASSLRRRDRRQIEAVQSSSSSSIWNQTSRDNPLEFRKQQERQNGLSDKSQILAFSDLKTSEFGDKTIQQLNGRHQSGKINAGGRKMIERRRKRNTSKSEGGGGNESDANRQSGDRRELDANEFAQEGSETILLSIEEQKERELNTRQHQSKAVAPSHMVAEAPTLNSTSTLSTPISSTLALTPRANHRQADVLFNEVSNRGEIAKTVDKSNSKSGLDWINLVAESQESTSQVANLLTTTKRPEKADELAAKQQLVMVPLSASNIISLHDVVNRNQESPESSLLRTVSSPSPHDSLPNANQLHHETPNSKIEPIQVSITAPLNQSTTKSEREPSKPIKRKKRTRRQQQQQQSANSTLQPVNSGDRTSFSSSSLTNLLHLALPDQMMSSDSIRKCFIEKYSQILRSKFTSDRKQSAELNKDEIIHLLQDKRVDTCLNLSNASQMFIIQLLATLLIVLTYLVNVDPRRVDLGYKSLSIGLAYFLAHMLTSNSGGFYGNPVQLLALVWFSSPPSADYNNQSQHQTFPIEMGHQSLSAWRGEWLIYLVTPLIGGLFGALSHEYIDFTSLRNRGKQLHLRRSFFSLENLAPVASSNRQQCELTHDITTNTHNNKLQTTTTSVATNGNTNEIAKRRPAQQERKVSRNSEGGSGSSISQTSDSIGAQSSIMTLNVVDQFEPTTMAPPIRQLESNCSRPNSYSSQLRLEQRLLTNNNNNNVTIRQQSSSKRSVSSSSISSLSSRSNRQTVSSDLLLDSNFLISSSSAAANSQQTGCRFVKSPSSRRLPSSCGLPMPLLVSNGRRNLSAALPICASSKALFSSHGNEFASGASGGTSQFACTSQFM